MGKTMTVDQVMSRGVFTIGKDQTLEMAHQLMEKHQVRHLPVMEGGKVVGMFTAVDALRVLSGMLQKPAA